MKTASRTPQRALGAVFVRKASNRTRPAGDRPPVSA